MKDPTKYEPSNRNDVNKSHVFLFIFDIDLIFDYGRLILSLSSVILDAEFNRRTRFYIARIAFFPAAAI